MGKFVSIETLLSAWEALYKVSKTGETKNKPGKAQTLKEKNDKINTW